MNNIEKRRIEMLITRKEICEELGICLKTYYAYAVQDKPIPSDKLIMLADMMDCTTDYLLGIGT